MSNEELDVFDFFEKDEIDPLAANQKPEDDPNEKNAANEAQILSRSDSAAAVNPESAV